MDVVSQTPVTLWVDFLTDTDDLVVADLDTVAYTLHDGTGVRISGPNQLIPTTDATGVSVSISDIQNTIQAPKLFDVRSVVVSWMAGGASGAARKSYRLVPFPVYSVDADTVRNVIGIASDELPDAEINIFNGYLIAAGRLGLNGRAVLDTALASGTEDAITAERLIAYLTVLQLLPSLQQRILQKKEDGTLKVERIKGIDPVSLGAALVGRINLDLNTLLGVTVDQIGVSPILVLTSPTTDPVTGAAPDTTL